MRIAFSSTFRIAAGLLPWSEVQFLATSQHHYLLASRAIGEQGIAAFLLGDIATAKKDVLKAWTIAKVVDPSAHIRYVSMYGTGLVKLHKYKEALGSLDEAIRVASKTRGAAYPTIASPAKIEALSGLEENKEALALAAEEMRRVSNLLDALLSKVPTPTVERQLLSDLSVVYAGYFVSLSDQGKLADAFRVIERARGRVEAQALAHHEVIPPHEPNPAEQPLTSLNVELLDKEEEVYGADYRDLEDARSRIGKFLEEVYNQRRLHSALRYLTPEEFEQAR
jgi:tetratricopeptide (TPR) repeat protein